MSNKLTITPIADQPLGAIVEGDINSELAGADIFALSQALNEHQVLVIKEQPITDAKLEEIGTWFGPHFASPPGIPVLGSAEQETVTVLSNKDGLGVRSNTELPFHSDFQFMPVPLKGACLHAVEVPPSEAGGDTSWSNLFMALEELDPELRSRIEGVKGIGINPYAGKQVAKSTEVADGKQVYLDGEVPDFPHPLVRTHPDTGRQSLYFSMFTFNLDIDDEAEERELIDALRAHVDQDHFYYHHKWSPGDTLIWDNRSTNHKRADFDQSYYREMHRVQIAGTKPF